MQAYIIRRLLLFPIILLAVSLITFSFIRILPGDAAVARLGATGAQCTSCFATVRKELGLDKPKAEQYVLWLKGAIHGDFGLSTSNSRPVAPELRERTWNTLQLGLISIVFSLILGIPIGVLSAVRPNGSMDYFMRFFSILGLSVPNFWIGTLVVFMPVIWWGWSPVKNWVNLTDDPLKHLALLLLPALVLAIGAAAYIARITRSEMLETLSSEHVRTARAKGLQERVVLIRHAIRNSMLTLLTVLGLQFGLILGGSVIIENIFTIPGIGAWIVTAVDNRDYQIVQAVSVVFAAWFLFITLLTDILYAWADPRIHY